MSLRLGALPAHPRWTHPRAVLDLHADLGVMAASLPGVIDWTANVPSYPMYLNDELGDCAEAGLGHAVQSVTAATGTIITPTDADILALYETQGYVPGNPATDQGTNLQNLLTLVLQPTAGAAPSPPASRSCGLVHRQHAGLPVLLQDGLRGGQLPRLGHDPVPVRQPWVPVAGDQIEGGHCIVLEEVTEGMDQLTWITWGAKQRSNRAWWRAYASEAWVIVTPQVLADPPPGLNAASLMGEFHSLS